MLANVPGCDKTAQLNHCNQTETNGNGQRLMRIITILFLKWFLPCADIFSCLRGGFLSQEASHLDLFGRCIILFENWNLNIIFAKNLAPVCIIFATVEQKMFVCHLISRAELTHHAFPPLPGLSLCRIVLMSACSRSLCVCLCRWWAVYSALKLWQRGLLDSFQNLFCSLCFHPVSQLSFLPFLFHQNHKC